MHYIARFGSMGDPDEKIFNGTCGEPVCLEIRGNRKNGIIHHKYLTELITIVMYSFFQTLIGQ